MIGIPLSTFAETLAKVPVHLNQRPIRAFDAALWSKGDRCWERCSSNDLKPMMHRISGAGAVPS